MDNYLYLFSASNEQIDFISKQPHSLWNLLEGSPCSILDPTKGGNNAKLANGYKKTISDEIPKDWPHEALTPLGPEINDFTIEIYHRILCGGDVYVEGAGSLFQTWLVRDKGSAIDIGGRGKHFAFSGELVSELKWLLSFVDHKRVDEQYRAWLKEKGDKHVPTLGEIVGITKEFTDLYTELLSVVNEGNGLIWIKA